VPFDTLIVAAGSHYNYFHHDHWQQVAPDLKTLESAVEIRARILRAFEAAELEPDPERRAAWLTFVVFGWSDRSGNGRPDRRDRPGPPR
jgi:NADH:ubiquinone reductase (H+-translocating)